MAGNYSAGTEEIETKIINKAGTVINEFEVKEGKIVGGCMDLEGMVEGYMDPQKYTVVPFKSRFVWLIDGEKVKHYNKILPYYPDGTLVFRPSLVYHESKMVTSITTTGDSMIITTLDRWLKKRYYLFNGVTNFNRIKKKPEEETIFENKIGTKITYWTQDERNSLFRNHFENIF
tara:strand:+ start:613 stop:1137 length:525 start_codon:yes stop_codon:yes gene_type:complete